MRHRALAILLALVVGLPAGLSVAAALVFEQLGRRPDLVPTFSMGPVAVFSPELGARLLPFLVRGHEVSLVLQGFAVAVVVPAGLAALAAAATRGKARGGAAAETAHGSARWATAADLRRADLFSKQGVVLGRWPNLPGLLSRRIVDGSDHHIMLVMPPGAGKTTGPILSTLATHRASSFVLDPKGELFETYVGWRKTMGHRVIRFAPTLGVGHRWNPLDEIERGPGHVAQVTELARNLISYPASTTEDGHWIAGARSLFVLLTLHVIYAETLPTTLAAARELLNTVQPDELFGPELLPHRDPHRQLQRARGHRHPAGRDADAAVQARRRGDGPLREGLAGRSGGLAGRRNTTHGWNEVKRPLLTEGEVGQLPPDRVLILKRGWPPVLARVGRWWQL
ncbi:MAG: type IV secretory system conjugative DNA transfer family protein [Thermoanaerobaculia bacterium]|nr:type IV secretory system conjugative DNA transfer family protein [Thermoanaerobaculia bacterium]